MINLTGMRPVDYQAKVMSVLMTDHPDAVTETIDRMAKPELQAFAHAVIRLLSERIKTSE